LEHLNLNANDYINTYSQGLVSAQGRIPGGPIAPTQKINTFKSNSPLKEHNNNAQSSPIVGARQPDMKIFDNRKISVPNPNSNNSTSYQNALSGTKSGQNHNQVYNIANLIEGSSINEESHR
jgi:hypothetical protein